MSKIGFVSLGCPKNLLDTEVMLGELSAAGYEITPEESEADIIVINTCAFIESAKKESIDNILDISWLKENGNLKGIVVTGCLSERYRDEILNEFPEVDAVLGTGSVHSIVKAVKKIEGGKRYSEYLDKNKVELGGDRIVTTGDAFAYLKISEGCNNICTYCAIPHIRGKFRSRPMDELVEEAKELVSMGIKELIVIGQDTTAYGIDLYGEYRLHELLRRLAEETDVCWLRVLYCYPDKITEELINEFKTNEKLVKYIDLPIQHINSRILKKMNRKGDEALIRSVIKKLREIDGMSIRSTAIVGFPTETEEEFVQLCEFVKEAKFDNFGAFPYSREEGTIAYDFDGQIDEQVKQDRYDIIMREQLSVIEESSEKHIGKVETVLCEGFDAVSETYYGRTSKNAPDIDGKVFFFSNVKHRVGDFVEVEIMDTLDDYDLSGKAI
ncbi:MAG: 30S ribosomal protein S12 methylthiotransferase RimO [Ruminococcaceae bacterium]|nr:30S ribosomal protein S12 methylthiotransferase RimO [Oscillospiraceae bacterium]